MVQIPFSIYDASKAFRTTKRSKFRPIFQAVKPIIGVGILNQSNFDALMLENHNTLLTPETNTLVWDKIQGHGLDQTDFQKLLVAAEQNSPLEKLQAVTSEFIGKHAETTTLLSERSIWTTRPEENPVEAFQPKQKP